MSRPNQFLSPEGDIEDYFVDEYWLIDQYVGDELWAWGNGAFYGGYGNVGNAQYNNFFTPVTTFAGGSNWKQVSNSGHSRSHTAAVKTDGTLWTWGGGYSGERGDAANRISRRQSTPITTFAGGTNWKQVSCGGFYTAAVKTDGTLWTWGNSYRGRLGNAVTATTFISTPITTFAGGTNWKQVSAGYEHVAAIKTDGTLWTWGSNIGGKLGNNSTVNASTPVTTLTGGTNWKQVSCGYNHTLAVKTDGTLWCWGNNSNGRLGSLDAVPYRITPVTTFAGGTNWADTATGADDELYTLSSRSDHTAAIKTDGTLWTWGIAGQGQLGNSSTVNANTPITIFAGGTNWRQISTGWNYTAAIKTDGTLWMWGLATYGRLGDGQTTGNISTPITTFAGGTNWRQVNLGTIHTTAIKTDGTLWTWGGNMSGRLGTNDTTPNRSTPVTTFAGGTNWKQVSGGDSHTAAIKTDGTLWTWGYNSQGRLGSLEAINPDRLSPVTTFAGGTNWADTATGADDELYTLSSNGHVAAIKTDGTLWMWGRGTYGQIGNTSVSVRTFTPVTTFTGGTSWRQVSNGNRHTAAIKTDGTLWTWGNGSNAALGTNDTTPNRSTPVTTFAGGTNWRQVSAGGYHTAAIKTDGTLWTWGNNSSAQIGRGIDTNVPGTPFGGGTNWANTATTASEDLFTITSNGAIKTDGTLWMWSGPLGAASITTTSTPITTFTGGTNWRELSVNGCTAAIKTDGTLWLWGSTSAGRLGNNRTTLSTVSTPITTFSGGTNWSQVSAGAEHCMAVKTDGTLWGWGFSSFGILGRPAGINSGVPVTTFAGGTNWRHVSTATRSTAAIKTDGTLWMWGTVESGRLGNAATGLSTDHRSTPITTFAGGTNWRQASCGYRTTAAIKTDGTLWTWGYNGQGALGINDTINRSTPVTTFAGGTNWNQVHVSFTAVAAVKTDGTLWTWGAGGNLGNASTTSSFTPVTTFAGGTNWKQVHSGIALRDDGVNREIFIWGFTGPRPFSSIAPDSVSGTNWKQVSASIRNTAAVKTDGTLWVWGNNLYRQLGTNGAATNITFPVTTFAGGTNWKQVACGYRHMAAVKTDGTLWTWGSGYAGVLGTNDTTPNRSTPVTTFAGGTNWKQVACGFHHTAAVKTDGTLWTWGGNLSGRLGTNDTTPNRSTPVTTFAGGTNWKQVACGGSSNSSSNIIALRDDGVNKQIFIWGNNQYGQLGNNYNSLAQFQVEGINWKQVSAGSVNTAAVKTDGTLWIWGSNFAGQLGNGGVFGSVTTPVTTFAGGTNWKQVTIDGNSTAAIKTDGTLWTWGNNNAGKLGNNSTVNASTPVTTLTGGTNWKQVSVGTNSVIALIDDGVNKQIFTWGSNVSSQLGDNYNRFGQFSVQGTNWKQVSSGSNHTAAVKTDGTLWTWGNRNSGRLGNAEAGYGFFAETPVTTFSGGTNWKQVSAGYDHTTAIKTDGTLWTWGRSSYGKLGTNDQSFNRSTPVTTFAGGTNWKQVSSARSGTAAVFSGITPDLPLS